MTNELKPLINEYNQRCRTWNVTTLAVSSLVKKQAIIRVEAEQVSDSVRNFVSIELEHRFQRLFADLVDAYSHLIEPAFNYKLEMALLRALLELEEAAEVDEAHLLLYETGVEVMTEITALVSVNVVELVNGVREDCQRKPRKIVDLTAFLESQMESKLHRSVFTL